MIKSINEVKDLIRSGSLKLASEGQNFGLSFNKLVASQKVKPDLFPDGIMLNVLDVKHHVLTNEERESTAFDIAQRALKSGKSNAQENAVLTLQSVKKSELPVYECRLVCTLPDCNNEKVNVTIRNLIEGITEGVNFQGVKIDSFQSNDKTMYFLNFKTSTTTMQGKPVVWLDSEKLKSETTNQSTQPLGTQQGNDSGKVNQPVNQPKKR